MINPWLSHILSHIKPILTMVFLCPWFSTTPAALAPSRLQELSERLFVALRQGPGLRSVQFFGLPQSPTKIEILRFITILLDLINLDTFEPNCLGVAINASYWTKMEKWKFQSQWHAFEGCQVNRPDTVTPPTDPLLIYSWANHPIISLMNV